MKGQFHFSIGGIRFLSNGLLKWYLKGPGKGLVLGRSFPVENVSKYPLEGAAQVKKKLDL